MAFENVFGNVRFDIPVNQANQRKQSFENMLGRITEGIRYKEEMDLKKQQLEMKANLAPLKRMAENALLKQNMNMPLTKQEEAAIQSMAQVAPPTYSTDAYGNPVMRPSGWSNLGSQSQPSMGALPQDMLSQPAPQMSNIPFPDIGGQGMTNVNDLPPLQGDMIDPLMLEQGTGDELPTYQAPAKFGAAGEIMEEESKQKAANYLTEKKIDSIFEQGELNKAAINEQKAYQSELDKLITGYERLLDSGSVVKTLGDDSTLSDVLSNVKASVSASPVGRTVTGSIGTQGAAAINEIEAVRPIIFGKLRAVMGMTGKELDTKQERDFYLNALTNPSTDIQTTLRILKNLDARFGTGESSERIKGLQNKIETKSKYNTREEKMQRLQELEQKMRSNAP